MSVAWIFLYPSTFCNTSIGIPRNRLYVANVCRAVCIVTSTPRSSRSQRRKDFRSLIAVYTVLGASFRTSRRYTNSRSCCSRSYVVGSNTALLCASNPANRLRHHVLPQSFPGVAPRPHRLSVLLVGHRYQHVPGRGCRHGGRFARRPRLAPPVPTWRVRNAK